jgi:hypothetical protein
MRAERWLLATALALAALPVAGFQALDPGQRQLLAPLSGAWRGLDEPTRNRLRANAAHWQALPAEQQRALVQRMTAWDDLPAATRARRRAPFAAWEALPRDEQAQLRGLAARVAALPEAERRVLRAGFDALASDERQDWWLGPRLGDGFSGLRPLFAFVPEGERPAMLQVLHGLSPDARADLKELARRLPASEREKLRRDLIAAAPAEREALISRRLGR